MILILITVLLVGQTNIVLGQKLSTCKQVVFAYTFIRPETLTFQSLNDTFLYF